MTLETGPTDSLPEGRLRGLALADLADGVALSTEASWNQNATDWRYLLAHGLGWGYEDPSGRLRATAMLLPYEDRIAWICMVLVTAGWRKRGLATMLLRHCIEAGEQRGWQLGLDATPAGRQVYLPLGVSDCYPIARMTAEGLQIPGPADRSRCRPMQESDLPAVGDLDAAVAGAARHDLLRSLFSRAPDLCWVCGPPENLRGFCLGRDGLNSDQIGPIVARHQDSAIALARQALLSRRQPARRVCIDVTEEQCAFRDWLQTVGFQVERNFVRMMKMTTRKVGRPAALFAIAGPELS